MTRIWPENLRICEAVIYSGLGEGLLRRLIREGALRAYRPTPRRTLVSRQDLDRYLCSIQVQPKAV